MSLPRPHPRRSSATIRVALAATLLVSACGDHGPTPQAAFENLSVAVAALDGRVVQLRDRSAEVPDEGASILLDDLHLTGTLDSPEHPITTGVLYTTREGSGISTELVVARQAEGPMIHLLSHPLGGRMRLEGLRYDEGAIVVHLLEYGPEDPPCCPQISSQRRFRLSGGELVEADGPEGTT